MTVRNDTRSEIGFQNGEALMKIAFETKFNIGEIVTVKANRIAAEALGEDAGGPLVCQIVSVIVEATEFGREVRYGVLMADGRGVEGEARVPETALELYEE